MEGRRRAEDPSQALRDPAIPLAESHRLITQEEVVEAVWGRIANEREPPPHAHERAATGARGRRDRDGRRARLSLLLDVETEKLPSGTPPARPRKDLVAAAKRERSWAGLRGRAAEQRRRVVFVTGSPESARPHSSTHSSAQIAGPRGATIAVGSVRAVARARRTSSARGARGGVPRRPRATASSMRSADTPDVVVRPASSPDEKCLHSTCGSKRPRKRGMLRELARGSRWVSRGAPFVLVLEECSGPTAPRSNLIAMLGARRESARVLVVGTCRQAELTKGTLGESDSRGSKGHRQQSRYTSRASPRPTSPGYLAQRLRNPRCDGTAASTLTR